MLCISHITQADEEAMFAFFSKVSSTNWSRDVFRRSLAKQCSLQAIMDDTLVGYCMVDTVLDEACIEDIAVLPSAQRQGIAKQLVMTLIDSLPQQGINTLFLEVRKSNKAARALYKHLGFDQVGERKGYYPALDGQAAESAVLMSKLLG